MTEWMSAGQQGNFKLVARRILVN